jgi:glycine cleavage system H protein
VGKGGLRWNGDSGYYPPVGKSVRKGEECGVVESVKAASDIYAPISGEVVAVNDALSGTPELINEDAYATWMFKLKPSNPAELDSLLEAAAYEKLIAAEEH